MKKIHSTIDQLLIAAAPNTKVSHDFVLQIMQKISAQNETFSPVLRTIAQPTKKERFMKLLRTQPAIAVLIALIAATLLSGAAYAVYQLWQKPKVTTSHTSFSSEGRQEAELYLQNCPLHPADLEIRKGQTMAPSDIALASQAQCEGQAILSWTNKTWPQDPKNPFVSVEPSQVGTVTSIDHGKITVTKDSNSYSFTPNSQVKYISKDARIISGQGIHKGDVVTVITRLTYGPHWGHPTSRTPLAIVQMSLPIKYYSGNIQSQLAQRGPCTGNPQDSCLQDGSSIDVFPRGSEDATNPMLRTDTGIQSYGIEGRIVSHNGNTFTIKGSSGTLYAIDAPSDVLGSFHSNGLTIETGDMLHISYMQNPDNTHTHIQAKDIQTIVLIIENGAKQGVVQKY